MILPKIFKLPAPWNKIELEEFRKKLHEYQNYIDSSMFICTFVDASHLYGDNLELILQGMEKAKIDYQQKREKAKDL